MTMIKSFWAEAHPYLKSAIAGLTGAVVIVFAPVVFAQLAAFATGGVAQWPAPGVLLRTFFAAAAVVGVAYWAKSPKGREVWTDEQRQGVQAALKDKHL